MKHNPAKRALGQLGWLCVTCSERAGAPTVEQFAEVCAIDLAVMIDVARTSRRPSGARPPSTEQNAEVCAIDCAIASQTRWALRACRFECDGVGVAPRDAGARSEIRGRVALAPDVGSPTPDTAIDLECNGVGGAPRDA
jgi:hypothetical protein